PNTSHAANFIFDCHSHRFWGCCRIRPGGDCGWRVRANHAAANGRYVGLQGRSPLMPTATNQPADGGLIGLDWGTSSLRAYQLDAAGTVREVRHRDWGLRYLPEGGFDAA